MKRFFGGRPDRSNEPSLLPPGDRFFVGGVETAYRAVRTVGGQHPATGVRVLRSGAGVSLRSREEAEEVAQARAQEALDRALRGIAADAERYLYLASTLEPLLQTVNSGPDEVARLTLNGYGSVVINASSTLFVDVDDRSDAPPASLAEIANARTMRFRVYRTFAGWRYLRTDVRHDPASDETRTILLELAADPKYALLCRVQRTFRARLTPKPWRARQRGVPRVSSRGEVRRDDLDRFLRKMQDFATAEFVGEVGPIAATLPDIAQVIDLHDRWCQVTSGKPLA